MQVSFVDRPDASRLPRADGVGKPADSLAGPRRVDGPFSTHIF
jgi:hypothetical protein